ncbi:paralemmin-3 [Eleutherodactylus coqui]|uniref:paralemmin-3 n=1 Tax=Eleutherodactylus coqui TaxID=57060 RepID=UPI0034617E71
MGETQIYSQRLHGITEKRRILGEVDYIQRELELQKVKLQQLKRKSLRDRWLMDGMVPAPGAETENPLSETEDKIKKLEDELEGLQLQLLYLENPEMKIQNLKKQQGSNLQEPIVNGDQSQQTSDLKAPTPDEREIKNDIQVVKQEKNLQSNGEDEKQGEAVDPTQLDPTPSKNVVVRHPIPAPRGIRISGNYLMEKNQDQISPDQKPDIVDQRNEEEHDKDIQNLNRSLEPQDDGSVILGPSEEQKGLNRSLEPQDDGSVNLGPSEEQKDESPDQELVSTDQDVLNQDSEFVDKRLEIEEENVEHLTKRLEHVDLSFNAEGPNVDDSQLSVANEDGRNDLDNEYDMVKVILFGGSEEHESEIQPSPVMGKQCEDQDEPFVKANLGDNSQDVEEKSVLVSIIQDQNEEITIPVGNQEQNEEYTLPRCQVVPVDPVPVLIGHDRDQDLESTSFPVHQSPVLLSSDQEHSTPLPCNDPDPNISLPCEDLVSQVQISQVVVISIPEHTSSGELVQPSSNSQQGPSTDHLHQPRTTEASTPAEGQPLLHKPPGTDAQAGERATNTAETRDKNPPVKKKSCQCCVVM